MTGGAAVEKLAQDGGKPVREKFLPFGLPFVGEEEMAEVRAAIESGWLTTGPRVQRFGEELAAYVGARHALPVNSCTGALHLALVALDVGPGDEVITSPLTFISTANVVLHTGAKVVFADVDRETFNIDPKAVEAAITPRTKVVLPVHFAGYPCDMDALHALARPRGIKVVEDAAHAISAEYKGRRIGSLSDATCFSFYPTKNMTTGEGGALTTDVEALADRVRRLMLHGMSRDAWKRFASAGSWYYEVVEPGFKYNLTDPAAAMGLQQLRRLDGFTATRERYARALDEAFAGQHALITPVVKGPVRHARHLYPLLIRPEELTVDRAEFIQALKAENIGSTVNFIPVHLHPYYRETQGFRPGMFPNAEWVYEREISLPLYPKMTPADLQDVARAVQKVVHWKGRRA
jgi:dTDP-4-amino-4,6-dideoxygalactose transaminase